MGGVNIALLTAAGIVNGLNPCSIGMVMTFLGYLIVFGMKGKKNGGGLVKMGLVYIGGVFITYLVLGLFFYNLAYSLQRSGLTKGIGVVMGGGLMVLGLLQLLEGLFPEKGIKLRFPESWSRVVNRLMEKVSLPMAGVLGVVMTAVGTPCILPLYVGTATVLANSGLPLIKILLYFLYYNLLFIFPMIVILLIMSRFKRVVELKEWGHRWERPLRVLTGLVIIVLGAVIW